MKRFVRRYLAAMFLVAALALGGASAAGVVANAILQWLALAVIAIVLLGGAMPKPIGSARMLSWLLMLVVAMMLAQLIPLPPTLWRALPGRGEVRDGFALAGLPLPWLPVSLSPDDSVAALLSMLPPVAMLVAIVASSARGRTYAVHALLGAVVVSLGLGAVQIAGGTEHGAYLYETTNLGSAVGFFANRNHFATLLLIALPFVVARGRSPGEAWSAAARRAWRGCAWVMVAMILMGIVAVGSVAGLVLAVPVMLACALLAAKGKWPRLRTGRTSLGGGAIIVIALTGLLGWARPDHPVADSDPQHRDVLTMTTLHAAFDYRPFGSGGGSFQTIYPSYEDPAAASPEYANHAHDDYAEALLDYGLPGALLIAAAIGMWIMRARTVWSGDDAGDDDARAGWVAVGVVLAHSGVDYPLRTAAIAVVATMAAALAAMPDPAPEPRSSDHHPQRTDPTGISVSIDEF